LEPDRRIRRIAIVGSGIAAWTAAATLARRLGGLCSIHVVDSAEPVTQGLAEATHPMVLDLLRYLGADQNDFVDKTYSTYRLGTRFSDWATPGTVSSRATAALAAATEPTPGTISKSRSCARHQSTCSWRAE